MRPDYLFSYWMILWFILYYIGFIDYNPSFAFLFSQILMVLNFYVQFFQYGFEMEKCAKEIVYIYVSKFLPLFLLWLRNDVQMRLKDIYFSIGLCLLYYLYLYVNNTDFIEVYTQIAIRHKCKNGCKLIDT